MKTDLLLKKLIDENTLLDLNLNGNNEICNWLQRVILKYCPIVENRLNLMDMGTKASELEINIYIQESTTEIIILYGNSVYKESIPEKIVVDGIINNDTIIQLIDFLLTDHECISNFDLQKSSSYKLKNTNELNIVFAINWSDKSIKGLNVGNIYLKINYGNNIEFTRTSVLSLLSRYKSVLEKTPTYNKLKNEYINQYKKDYIESLSRHEMVDFLSFLDNQELKDLLMMIDGDTFVSIVNNKTKKKVLD